MNKSGYKKWLVILIHAAAWILLFSLPTLLRPAGDQHTPKQPETVDTTMHFIAARFTDLLLIIFFYLNAGVLMVRLFYKKRYLLYVLTVLLCSAGFTILSWLVVRELTHTDSYTLTLRRHMHFAIFILLFILACSIAYKTIRDTMVSDKLASERQNEN